MTRSFVSWTAATLMLVAVSGCGGGGTGAPGDQLGMSDPSAQPPSTEDAMGEASAPSLQDGPVENSAVLSWSHPTINNDGTPLTDLAGFRVYHSDTIPLSKQASIWISVGERTIYAVAGLTPGVHYFAVSAVDRGGNESELSETVSKSVS